MVFILCHLFGGAVERIWCVLVEIGALLHHNQDFKFSASRDYKLVCFRDCKLWRYINIVG